MNISNVVIGPCECRNVAENAVTDKAGNTTQRCNFVWMGGEKTWKVPSHLCSKFAAGDIVQLSFEVEKLTVMPQSMKGDEGTINYNDIFAKLSVVNEVKVARGKGSE